jgi:hypothetical protein
MDYRMSGRDARFSTVLFSPFDRLEMNPLWGRGLAGLGAVIQYLRTDAFSLALLMVVLVGIIDYWLGVKAAKSTSPSSYDPIVAHRGAMGKVSGVLLLFLVRVLEGFVQLQGWGNTKGAAATAIAISLFIVDFQSIAHHREEFGAQPIPLLGAFLNWIQRILARVFAPPEDKK